MSTRYEFYHHVWLPSRSQTLSNLYAAPVSAPECLGLPNALLFKPKGNVMEQDVGEHTIT